MIEGYQKEIDKREAPAGEKKEWEPSLKDILSKKEDSDLFGELLKREDEPALVSRLAKGELSEGDISELDTYRKDFLSTMEKVKEVKESISDDLIQAYTRNNPDLQKVVGLIGTAEYRNIIKEKIAKLSITEPDSFEQLSTAIKGQKEFKEGDYKKFDAEIAELCANKKIDSGAYFKALAIEEPKKREEALRGAVRDGYGKFQKAMDWVSAGGWSKNRVKLLESKREVIDDYSKALQMHQSDVGGFLSAMTDNEQILNAVSKELVGEKEEKVPLGGFKEARVGMPTEESVQKQWEVYKESMGYDWETMEETDRNIERSIFTAQQKKAQQERNTKKTGFWESIFGAFFDSFFTKEKLN